MTRGPTSVGSEGKDVPGPSQNTVIGPSWLGVVIPVFRGCSFPSRVSSVTGRDVSGGENLYPSGRLLSECVFALPSDLLSLGSHFSFLLFKKFLGLLYGTLLLVQNQKIFSSVLFFLENMYFFIPFLFYIFLVIFSDLCFYSSAGFSRCWNFTIFYPLFS